MNGSRDLGMCNCLQLWLQLEDWRTYLMKAPQAFLVSMSSKPLHPKAPMPQLTTTRRASGL